MRNEGIGRRRRLSPQVTGVLSSVLMHRESDRKPLRKPKVYSRKESVRAVYMQLLGHVRAG